jgi:hypothetical protein
MPFCIKYLVVDDDKAKSFLQKRLDQNELNCRRRPRSTDPPVLCLKDDGRLGSCSDCRWIGSSLRNRLCEAASPWPKCAAASSQSTAPNNLSLMGEIIDEIYHFVAFCLFVSCLFVGRDTTAFQGASGDRYSVVVADRR